MSCSYSYLQENFYKRFDGAVSITVALKVSEHKVEGSSPSKTFFFTFFYFFAFAKMQVIFRDLHVCKKKHVLQCNVLCTCKATSLSKMVKLVWRCSDDARAIIENVYKTARRKRICS